MKKGQNEAHSIAFVWQWCWQWRTRARVLMSCSVCQDSIDSDRFLDQNLTHFIEAPKRRYNSCESDNGVNSVNGDNGGRRKCGIGKGLGKRKTTKKMYVE